MPPTANPPYKLPPPLFDARCKACWFSAGLLVLVMASFWSLDLQWAQFFSLEAAQSMALGDPRTDLVMENLYRVHFSEGERELLLYLGEGGLARSTVYRVSPTWRLIWEQTL